MYGLPWVLTGAILAQEVMHAWVAENNLNCGHSDGDDMLFLPLQHASEHDAGLHVLPWHQMQVLVTP